MSIYMYVQFTQVQFVLGYINDSFVHSNTLEVWQQRGWGIRTTTGRCGAERHKWRVTLKTFKLAIRNKVLFVSHPSKYHTLTLQPPNYSIGLFTHLN